MAKKQTRRSISVSRSTYERLKAFCETNGISMSQFVENRVGDFLGEGAELPETGSSTGTTVDRPAPAPRPAAPTSPPRPVSPTPPPKSAAPAPSFAPRPPPVTPMTSAAARYAIEPPPPPIIKKPSDQPAPKAPAVPKANEIFTF